MITYTNLVDDVEAILQDSGNTYFDATLIGQYYVKAFRDAARYIPHLVCVKYTIESRYGSATSTSSDELVDANNDQFLSTDTNKRVYNTTDHTWATISSYSDAETVGLTADIFASGEGYKIFNKGCTNSKQINIEDVTTLDDFISVERVEYPIGVPRDFSLTGANNEILEIKYDDNMPDSSLATSDTIVHVYFNKRHKVSQLTDFAGAVKNASGYSAGDTSMALDALQSTGTIEEGQEFTVPYSPYVYTVTSAASISSNESTISFYPGLEIDIADDTVVTFKASTLTSELEVILPEYVAGDMMISESSLEAQQISAAITLIDTANTNIDSAVTQLAAASSLPNTVTVGLGVTDYINYANGYMNASNHFLAEVKSRMNAAVERMEGAGRRKKEEAKAQLNGLAKVKTSQVYSRG